MLSFDGKEFDTITLVPSYVVGSIIVDTMETDERYQVDPDSKIAILHDSTKSEAVSMFHALDVNKVIEAMEIAGFDVDRGTSVDESKGTVSEYLGRDTITFAVPGYKLTLPVLAFLDKGTGRISRVTDIEYVRMDAFEEWGEGEWDKLRLPEVIGFKKSDPTRYFIEGLRFLLQTKKKAYEPR